MVENTQAIAALIALLLIVAIVLRLRLRHDPPSATEVMPTNGTKCEKHGKTRTKETLTDFRPPKPAPYPDWSIEHTKPLPYRPFRYGPEYHVTMGLRVINHEDWIELDSQFPKFHAEKARRIIERGDKCTITAPEAYPAAVELLEELARYLPDRYPTLFHRTETGRLVNSWSGDSFNVTERPLREDPLTICARLVQDDLAIMMKREDGQYRLLAGSILLAGTWRLMDKFGMTLSQIHETGDVPQFREKLEAGMVKFFGRLRPDQLYARHNYFMQVDDGLGWSHSIGSEDAPGESRGWGDAKDQEGSRAVEDLWFRSERQTLRRLPQTGAVVFTIRTYFHPMTEVAGEDYVPGRLASAIRSWGPDVRRYKRVEKYQRVLLEYLDGEHRKQLERGLDLSKEDKRRRYPW